MNKIHPTAEVSSDAVIGDFTSIWNCSQIREKAIIGKNCILGKDVYVDKGVVIGNNVKIQNGVSVYSGVTIEDDVFVGPGVVFTNDKYPRATNSENKLKTQNDWMEEKTLIKKGASLGANCTILPGIIVGDYAMVGAGSVVTKNVTSFGLVVGNPAKLVAYVCKCGIKIIKEKNHDCNK